MRGTPFEYCSLYRSEYNPYFRTNSKLFPATEFLVEVLQHLPDAGARLIRRYGLYSSRSRGTWSRKPHLLRLVPTAGRRTTSPGLLCTSAQPPRTPRICPCPPRSPAPPGRGCSQRSTRLIPSAAPVVVARCGSSPSSPIPRRSSESSATSSKPARLPRALKPRPSGLNLLPSFPFAPDSCPHASRLTLAHTPIAFCTPPCLHNASRQRFLRRQVHPPCCPGGSNSCLDLLEAPVASYSRYTMMTVKPPVAPPSLSSVFAHTA
jgi:hypothetical protein